jgi:methionyl aminopeptidase
MTVESEADRLGLAASGSAVAATLAAMRAAVEPGVTTAKLDAVAFSTLGRHGAESAPARFFGFPGAACISVNDEAVHGIPGSRVLRAGDLVKLDVTAVRAGYVTDAALTVQVPPVTTVGQALIAAAENAFWNLLAVVRRGTPLIVTAG